MARLFDNLIEAVNIIGSIFYGTILGIFTVAFFYKKLSSGTKVVGFFTLGLLFGIVGTGIIRSAFIQEMFPNFMENDVPIIVSLMLMGGLIGYWTSDRFFKEINGSSVFTGAVVAQASVITIYFLDRYDIIDLSYLWLNLIGCTLVIFVSLIAQNINKENSGTQVLDSYK